MLSSTLREKARKFRRQYQASVLIPGELIAVANDSGTTTVKVDDPDTPNMVWVKLYGQDERIVQAYNTKVTPREKMPVLLRHLPTGEFVIAEGDPIAGTDFYGEAAGTVFLPQVIGALTGWTWTARSLEIGRVRLSEVGGMTVYVEPFYFSGGYFAGGTLDLSGNVPTTTDKQAWAVVWYDPASAALGATNGDEYDLVYTMTEVDLGAIALPVQYIRLAGVLLTEGDTALSGNSVIKAAQNWIDAPVTDESFFPMTITDERTIPTNRQLAITTVTIDTGGTLTINGRLDFVS